MGSRYNFEWRQVLFLKQILGKKDYASQIHM